MSSAGLRAIVIWILVTAGCDRTASPLAQPSPSPVPAVTKFAERLAADGGLGFISSDGKILGFDSDTVIVFRPHGVAEMTRYGIGGGTDFTGRYDVAPNGE